MENSSPTPETYNVRQLCQSVEAAISTSFEREVWVKGAISGLKRSANGHAYFDLIDPSDKLGTKSDAVMPVVLFSAKKQEVNRSLRNSGGVRMVDGIEIKIRGKVGYYPPQARVQLVMSKIDPLYTLGQMMKARQQLLDKLKHENLLKKNAERRLNVLPLRVALITSKSSAAFADFSAELQASPFSFEVSTIDSRTQGVEAVESVVWAINRAESMEVDVVVVIRGGGAKTDLVGFDHETVARAIANSTHPVLVGVGHETDRSVADEVAYLSAKTPTACAAFLVDRVANFSRRLDTATERLSGLSSYHTEASDARLKLAAQLLATGAKRQVERQSLVLSQKANDLRRSPKIVAEAERKIQGYGLRLKAHDPLVALQRGWTITRNSDGQLLRSATEVEPGDVIETLTAAGKIASVVTAASETT